MGMRVTYGCNEFLEMPDVGWIVSLEAEGVGIAAVVDVASRTASRLSSPLDLPPLRECVTVDDRIVLALRRGTPQGDEIAAATVKYLSSFLTPGQEIVILRTPADELAGRGDPCEHLAESARNQVRVKTHRSEQTEEIAYLARFQSGHDGAWPSKPAGRGVPLLACPAVLPNIGLLIFANCRDTRMSSFHPRLCLLVVRRRIEGFLSGSNCAMRNTAAEAG